jgi:hypothetical protein
MTGAVQIRSFLAWTALGGASSNTFAPQADLTGAPLTHAAFGGVRVAYALRWPDAKADARATLPDLVLGDTADIDQNDFLNPSAGGVPIRFDANAQLVRFSTSLVGMPPIYVYRTERVAAITSDIHLLLLIPGVKLEFDVMSVAEHGYVGHPVEHSRM